MPFLFIAYCLQIFTPTSCLTQNKKGHTFVKKMHTIISQSVTVSRKRASGKPGSRMLAEKEGFEPSIRC